MTNEQVLAEFRKAGALLEGAVEGPELGTS